MKKWYVYIITNKRNWTLYTWVTSDLVNRIFQHKNKIFEGFSKKYDLTKLVFFQEFSSIEDAIIKEKYLKWKSRKYKIELIETVNKDWNDLAENLWR